MKSIPTCVTIFLALAITPARAVSPDTACLDTVSRIMGVPSIVVLAATRTDMDLEDATGVHRTACQRMVEVATDISYRVAATGTRDLATAIQAHYGQDGTRVGRFRSNLQALSGTGP